MTQSERPVTEIYFFIKLPDNGWDFSKFRQLPEGRIEVITRKMISPEDAANLFHDHGYYHSDNEERAMFLGRLNSFQEGYRLAIMHTKGGVNGARHLLYFHPADSTPPYQVFGFREPPKFPLQN